eukprot:scaffold2401_cov111-Cylindrotheca_fusiformis.AAC.4
MRLSATDSPNTPSRTPNRWNQCGNPERASRSNESKYHQKQYYPQQQQLKLKSHSTGKIGIRRGFHDDSRDGDDIMKKIWEFERIVNVSQARTPESTRRTSNYRDTPGNERNRRQDYNQRREGPPPIDGRFDGRVSKSSSSGYSDRHSSTSGFHSIPERALADAISPQESQNGSINFFPVTSTHMRRNNTKLYGPPQRTRNADGPKGNGQALGQAMASDFANFMKSPCKKIHSETADEGTDMSPKPKIWDYLDPEEDVTPADRRNVIRRKKKEKRAMEEAYRDLMMISPPKVHLTNDRRRNENQKSMLAVPQNDQRHNEPCSTQTNGYAATDSTPTPSNISSGSQTNSSLSSSTIQNEIWGQNLQYQRASVGHVTVSSDPPHSDTAGRTARDYYPRTSNPYLQSGEFTKPSNLRTPRARNQEHYPTKDEMNETSIRRVQFSKCIDPDLHQYSKSPSKGVVQKGLIDKTTCLGSIGMENGEEVPDGATKSVDTEMEKTRQELWAAKLSDMFPAQENKVTEENSAINCIAGDLKQFEQTLKEKSCGQDEKVFFSVSSKKTQSEVKVAKPKPQPKMKENMIAPVENPTRNTYMYVAYSRFSDRADDVLQLCERSSIPCPNRKAGEVLIKVQACSISLFDCEVRRGTREEMQLSPYIIPGTAFCGQIPVTEKKSTFSRIAPGDVVISLLRSGSNARYVCAPKDHLVKVPPKIKPEEAACLVETYLTAFQVLHLSHKSSMRYRDNSLKGQSILIMVGGFSSLSRAFTEVAKIAGVECCYVLVEKNEFQATSKFGAIPLSKDPQQWLTLVGNQIDLLVACNDHKTRTETISRDHLKALNREGEIVLIGRSGVEDFSQILEQKTSKASKLICKSSRRTLHDRCQMYNVFDSWDKDLKQSKRDLEHLLVLLKKNKVRPPVQKRISLSEVAKAQSMIESKRLAGHLVCLPWGSESIQSKDRNETKN